MPNKNTLKNKRYLDNNDIEPIKFDIQRPVKNLFFEATRNQGTYPSEVLRKFILKYNSSYINKYESKSNKIDL